VIFELCLDAEPDRSRMRAIDGSARRLRLIFRTYPRYREKHRLLRDARQLSSAAGRARRRPFSDSMEDEPDTAGLKHWR
jgi:hypothetical protein